MYEQGYHAGMSDTLDHIQSLFGLTDDDIDNLAEQIVKENNYDKV